MGKPKRARLLLLALFVSTIPARAQDPTPTPSLTPSERFFQDPKSQAAALRAAIARLPAAPVKKATVTMAPQSTAPTAGKPAAGTTTAITSTPPTLSADIAEVKPAPPKLHAREILFVPLSDDDEVKTRTAVVAQMLEAPPTARPVPLAPASSLRFVVFDGAIRTLTAAGAELTLKAVVLGGAPLRYVPDRRRFEGTLNVGVVDVGGQGGAHRLSEPIVFQVTGPLTATPELARVETTAPPYQSVSLSGDSVNAAIELLVTSSVTPEGLTFKVPVMPALFIDVTPKRIQGWGLETADVEVQARAMPEGGNRLVQLAADIGNLDPRRLILDDHGSGEASIRSASTGKSTVTVAGPAFAAATAAVEFVFPSLFLLAGLVGGIAGGSLRIGLPRPGRLGRFFARLAAAVICGFIVLGLYVLGVNVIGFQLPARAGEVLVFVVAALGALGGVALLKPKAPAS